MRRSTRFCPTHICPTNINTLIHRGEIQRRPRRWRDVRFIGRSRPASKRWAKCARRDCLSERILEFRGRTRPRWFHLLHHEPTAMLVWWRRH